MTRPIVAVVPTGPEDADAIVRIPPLLAALAESGRRVGATALAPRRSLFGGRGRVHAEMLRGLAEVALDAPITLPDGAPERAGPRLARALGKAGLSDAALLCRGEHAARVGLVARGASESLRVVLVLPDAGADESPSESGTLRDVDAVVCATEATARRVVTDHSRSRDSVARVPPLAVPLPDAEAARTAARRRLRLREDEIVVALTGSLAEGTLPDGAALLFGALGRLRPDVRFVIATGARTRAKQLLRAARVRRVLVSAAPTPQDAGALVAADYVLLLREAGPATRCTALPEFGDALVCGVRPVLSPGIGDQSDVCAAEGLGVILSTSDAGQAAAILGRDMDWPAALGPEARARRRVWVEQHIAPAPIAERVCAVIDALG